MNRQLSHILLATFTVFVATLAIVIDSNAVMILGLYVIAFGSIITAN